MAGNIKVSAQSTPQQPPNQHQNHQTVSFSGAIPGPAAPPEAVPSKPPATKLVNNYSLPEDDTPKKEAVKKDDTPKKQDGQDSKAAISASEAQDCPLSLSKWPVKETEFLRAYEAYAKDLDPIFKQSFYEPA